MREIDKQGRLDSFMTLTLCFRGKRGDRGRGGEKGGEREREREKGERDRERGRERERPKRL